MIFDANVFIGDSLYRNSFTVDKLKAVMETNGVEKALVRPLKPVDFNFDRANYRIGELQAKNRDLFGFGRVNPWEKEAALQVRRAIRDYGLKGIHLHPWEENFRINSEVAVEIMTAIAEEKAPVYISAGYPVVSDPLKVLDLMKQFPDVTAIVTHGCQQDMSGLSFDEALIVAEETKNVVFDISGVYRRDFIELLVERAGEDRVVLGSCTPYMDMHLEIARIQATLLPQEIKERILHVNLERILKMIG